MTKSTIQIGSTEHSLAFANAGKRGGLDDFVEEFRRVVLEIFDIIWEDGYKEFSIENSNFNLPKYLDYKIFGITTKLSARALMCAANQAGATVRAVTERQRRNAWKAGKGLKIKELKFSKPRLDKERIYPELSHHCVDIRFTSGQFAGFVRLKSLGDFEEIILPICHSSQLNKWKVRAGEPASCIKIHKKHFRLAWKWERQPHPQGEKVLGADQGKNTLLALSDGQTTPEKCPHGHSYSSILDKLARKKKGSRAFRRAQAHRKNHANWAINQLDFSNAKELRLEEIVNIRRGKATSRLMSHWSNPEIRDKVKRKCEAEEVPFVFVPCAGRSQRCSQCGVVRKSNRVRKIYSCADCGAEMDADFNASLNGMLELPPLPAELFIQKWNTRGFLWKPEGIFRLDGTELGVPCESKIFQ